MTASTRVKKIALLKHGKFYTMFVTREVVYGEGKASRIVEYPAADLSVAFVPFITNGAKSVELDFDTEKISFDLPWYSFLLYRGKPTITFRQAATAMRRIVHDAACYNKRILHDLEQQTAWA